MSDDECQHNLVPIVNVEIVAATGEVKTTVVGMKCTKCQKEFR